MTLSVILTAASLIFSGFMVWLITRGRETISDEEAARRYQERIIRREK